MSFITFVCFWSLEGPLHAGTGLSRGGFADRLICRRSDGTAFLRGDAVKGAIRMSAERLLHWLVPDAEPEDEDKSFPKNAVLRRIFQPDESALFYRFEQAWLRSESREPSRISSTALSRE